MITEIKDLYKGGCDKCGKLHPQRLTLVFTDNGSSIEDRPELWCFDCQNGTS
jgi:hypothetical protein